QPARTGGPGGRGRGGDWRSDRGARTRSVLGGRPAPGAGRVEDPMKAPVPGPELSAPVRRFALGDLELISVCDGFLRLDGGAMFGVVPKPLWEPKATPDERNRI